MDAIIYDKIDEVQGKVEYNGGGINALKQDTAALLAKGVVKSAQRGIYGYGSFSKYEFVVSIPINAVDPQKSILSHNFWVDESCNIQSIILYESKIEVRGSVGSGSSGTFALSGDWQVVEFY